MTGRALQFLFFDRKRTGLERNLKKRYRKMTMEHKIIWISLSPTPFEKIKESNERAINRIVQLMRVCEMKSNTNARTNNGSG